MQPISNRRKSLKPQLTNCMNTGNSWLEILKRCIKCSRQVFHSMTAFPASCPSSMRSWTTTCHHWRLPTVKVCPDGKPLSAAWMLYSRWLVIRQTIRFVVWSLMMHAWKHFQGWRRFYRNMVRYLPNWSKLLRNFQKRYYPLAQMIAWRNLKIYLNLLLPSRTPMSLVQRWWI